MVVTGFPSFRRPHARQSGMGVQVHIIVAQCWYVVVYRVTQITCIAAACSSQWHGCVGSTLESGSMLVCSIEAGMRRNWPVPGAVGDLTW